MNVNELCDIASDQLQEALAQAQERKEIEGVTFNVAFRKTPAFEIKAVFSFAKGTVFTEEG